MIALIELPSESYPKNYPHLYRATSSMAGMAGVWTLDLRES